MRICLLGHFEPNPADGIRNITCEISSRLSVRHDVYEISIRDCGTWRKVDEADPHIMHWIVGPYSIADHVIGRLLCMHHPKTKVVMSALHPSHNVARLGALIRPDLVLSQSQESQQMFERFGYRTRFLPNGVDVEKFAPSSPSDKARMREKYGVAENKIVVLHVGPIKDNRNIAILKKIQSSEYQVLLVARTRIRQQRRLYRELQQRNIRVMTRYFPKIEELYRLSDYYIFPTTEKKACIEMPLSVLEAMACNLPVISTRFGALPRVFREGDGLTYAKNGDDIISLVKRVGQSFPSVSTREKVLPYSWNNIIRRLEGIYESLIG